MWRKRENSELNTEVTMNEGAKQIRKNVRRKKNETVTAKSTAKIDSSCKHSSQINQQFYFWMLGKSKSLMNWVCAVEYFFLAASNLRRVDA